jgi:hypothetical protein
MNLEPPSGSRISVTTNDTYPLIVVPHKGAGVTRYFVGPFLLAWLLFLLAWLDGWLAGFSSALSKLSSGETFDRAQHAFLVFWLVAWTLGGAMAVLGDAMAVYSAYRAFRPSVPESLRLMQAGVIYDSGIPALQTSSGYTEQRCMEVHVSEKDAHRA